MEKKCMACNATDMIQGHHVLYDPELTIPLCQSCHLKARLQQKENILNITMRHAFGLSLLKQLSNIEYGQKTKFIGSIAEERKISSRELYYYTKFANTVPDVYKFLGKHPKITWNKIRNNLNTLVWS